MHTIILAIVIALAGLMMIASGALQLSMLEAAEGETLQMSDYLSEIGTLASGLGMLGLAEILRLLLRDHRLTSTSRSASPGIRAKVACPRPDWWREFGRPLALDAASAAGGTAAVREEGLRLSEDDQ